MIVLVFIIGNEVFIVKVIEVNGVYFICWFCECGVELVLMYFVCDDVDEIVE